MTRAVLAPSSAHVWGKPNGCTAYPKLAALYPPIPADEKEEDASQGTAAHAIGAALVDAFAHGRDLPFSDFEGLSDDDGTPFTIEQYQSARVYAEFVGRVMRSTGNFAPQVEKAVFMPMIHEANYGTLDCGFYSVPTATLHLFDFKHGLRRVGAYENWQLLDYAPGLARLLGLDMDHITLALHIVQPRAYSRLGPVDTWTLKPGEYRAYQNILESSAAEAMGPNPVRRSGTHCRHCPARGSCPAALESGWQLYEAASTERSYLMTALEVGVQTRLIRQAIERLEALQAAYEAKMEHMHNAGEVIPYWTLEHGRGSTSWTRSPEEVIRLGKLFGQDLSKAAVKTPRQAIALGIDSKVINGYSKHSHGPLKLRPHDGEDAKRVFGV